MLLDFYYLDDLFNFLFLIHKRDPFLTRNYLASESSEIQILTSLIPSRSAEEYIVHSIFISQITTFSLELSNFKLKNRLS